MFEYNISVSMADSSLSITDPQIIKLLKDAIELTNKSRNSKLKGRFYSLWDIPIDETHVKITLKSDTEVIPTRALSSLSRAIIAIDEHNIIRTYRHCVFNAFILDDTSINKKTSNISDVEIITNITEMVFGQSSMNNRDKKLSREYAEIIRKLVIEYINKKSLMK